MKAFLLASASLLLVSACQTAQMQPAGRVRGDSRTVTATELSVATQTDLYAYVQAERPRWLQSRSPGSLGGPALGVLVFINNQRLGGTEQLRSITVSAVQQIRFYDAAEAQQRFNVRNAGGVISVITK